MNNTDFGYVGRVFPAGSDLAYALAYPRANSRSGSLLRYDRGRWALLEEDVGHLLWANQTVVVVAAEDRVLRGDPRGSFNEITGLPVGQYVSLWAFGPDDIWLLNHAGQLVHFDGEAWTAIDTRMRSEARGLWGSPDGTLYFVGGQEFGRWRNDEVELLVEFSAVEDSFGPIWFTSISGASSSEVFIGARDGRLQGNRCAGVFMLWFDGERIRQF